MKSYKFSRALTLVCAVVGLSACAVDNQSTGTRGIGLTYQSAVKPLPDGIYYIEAEAALLAGRQSGAEAVATGEATNFCELRKQKLNVLKKELDSHLVVNGVAKLTFRCE